MFDGRYYLEVLRLKSHTCLSFSHAIPLFHKFHSIYIIAIVYKLVQCTRTQMALFIPHQWWAELASEW